jgi:hypothetical protein
VHVVSFNHLDVGYNGIAPTVGFINNVPNRYFVDYFPRAIAVAQALRALGGEERLVYTSHPFLLSLYLDCPANFTLAAGITLACPSADDVAALEAAVQREEAPTPVPRHTTNHVSPPPPPPPLPSRGTIHNAARPWSRLPRGRSPPLRIVCAVRRQYCKPRRREAMRVLCTHA